jgi:hypothetical protein
MSRYDKPAEDSWTAHYGSALGPVSYEDSVSPEFFGLDKADYGLVSVHCDVWPEFIFMNLAEEPAQSFKEFLGPMIRALEGVFPLNDQEVLCWHLHQAAAAWVDDYQKERRKQKQQEGVRV